MVKKALIVGINYPNSPYQLRGCVNDALAMEALLKDHFDFKDITLLLDGAATTDTMLYQLEKLVAGATAGDVLFFHYSGHGSQYPDKANDTDHEPDGLDEIIVPVDMNWRDKMIRDDDLTRIFDKVPDGVNLTVVLDCCNSGGGLDQYNQYQPLGEARKMSRPDPVKGGRFLEPPAEAMALVESRKLDFYKPRALVRRDLNQTGLLISGCQSHQTSADAFIGGKYIGACTYMIIAALKANDCNMDYKTLIDNVNHRMVKYKFSQRPELNGSAGLFRFKFLAPMGGEDAVYDPKPVKPKPLCKRCHNIRKECTCSPRYKRIYWRGGRWKARWRRMLKKWRRQLRAWTTRNK